MDKMDIGHDNFLLIKSFDKYLTQLWDYLRDKKVALLRKCWFKQENVLYRPHLMFIVPCVLMCQDSEQRDTCLHWTQKLMDTRTSGQKEGRGYWRWPAPVSRYLDRLISLWLPPCHSFDHDTRMVWLPAAAGGVLCRVRAGVALPSIN